MKKEAINLKKKRNEGYMGGLRGRRRKRKS